MQVLDVIYSKDLAVGMPGPTLIRFVGKEAALLSNANGGPRLFWNIEVGLLSKIGIYAIRLQYLQIAILHNPAFLNTQSFSQLKGLDLNVKFPV